MNFLEFVDLHPAFTLIVVWVISSNAISLIKIMKGVEEVPFIYYENKKKSS